MNLKTKQKRSALVLHRSAGFTLLELLTAVSIFAVTVVMVVGSFGISTKNQRTIRANRDVSQNNRFSINEIAKEIEFSYNGPLKNRLGETIQDNQKINNVYNFAILNTSGSHKTVDDNSRGGVLYLRNSDNHCRYYQLEKVDNINRVAVYIDKNTGCGESVDVEYEGPFYLTDENTNVEGLYFHGKANIASLAEQAYVGINLELINSDQSEFSLPMQSRTIATIRNYGREN